MKLEVVFYRNPYENNSKSTLQEVIIKQKPQFQVVFSQKVNKLGDLPLH